MANEGLIIAGTVNGRAKKAVGENKVELVTYRITAGGKDYYVKDWKPDGSYFSIGEKIETPVSVKVYSKNGQTSLDYSILRSSMAGDEF